MAFAAGAQFSVGNLVVTLSASGFRAIQHESVNFGVVLASFVASRSKFGFNNGFCVQLGLMLLP